jgi:valyl-tRNA synthetase
VRDADGRKMSKSVGNVIDPLEVMERYGTDAFRFTLAAFAAMGRDIKLSAQRIEGYRNFANKIWNAARFVHMQLGDDESAVPIGELQGTPHDRSVLSLADRWILSRVEGLVVDVRDALDRYEFNTGAGRLYEFVWHEYCDWYVELSKLALTGSDVHAAAAARMVLTTVLEKILRLLHPIMPFITEELWQSLPEWARSRPGEVRAAHLAVASYPEPSPERVDAATELTMGRIIQVIRAVRNLRAEVGLPPAARVGLSVFASEATVREEMQTHRAYIEALARVDDMRVLSAPERPADSVVVALEKMELYVPVLGLIDVETERRRLEREYEKAKEDLAAVRGKLGNSQFVSRAPEHVVEKERDREARLIERCEVLERGARRLREVGIGP